MKRRDFGAGARVCFAAVVRWAIRVAGVMGLEMRPPLQRTQGTGHPG